VLEFFFLFFSRFFTIRCSTSFDRFPFGREQTHNCIWVILTGPRMRRRTTPNIKPPVSIATDRFFVFYSIQFPIIFKSEIHVRSVALVMCVISIDFEDARLLVLLKKQVMHLTKLLSTISSNQFMTTIELKGPP